MNTEVGAIIRQKSAGAVQPLAMPFVGQAAFPVLEYMDAVKESSHRHFTRFVQGLMLAHYRTALQQP
jgi:hypothetical protein